MTSGRRASILLIVVDALRADRLSCYGGREGVSPALDMLASEGSRFSQAMSASPWTLPSFASLLTGTYPSSHRADADNPCLPQSSIPVSEFARGFGYETFFLSNTSWVSEETGFDRGFQRFWKGWQLLQDRIDPVAVRMASSSALNRSRLNRVLKRHPLRNAVNLAYASLVRRLQDKGAARTNAAAKRWLGRHKGGGSPFFGVIHYLEPHLPYSAPRSYVRRFLPRSVTLREARRVTQDAWSYIAGLRSMTAHDLHILGALYEGEIAYVDEKLGELIRWLSSAGILDETLLVITADHGENLGDHGLMDHQYSLHQSVLHVPLIIRWPARLAQWRGKVDTEIPVSLVDVAPTLVCAMGGDEGDIEDMIEGMDGVPLWRRNREGVLFAEYLHPQPSVDQLSSRFPTAAAHALNRSIKAARQASWKLIWDSDDDVQLFDLGADPGETSNLAHKHPGVVQALQRGISCRLGRPIAPDGQSALGELDPLVRKRLEELGYF